MNAHLATLPLWADLVLCALLVTGAAFALIGSWGLARLSDFFKRLHGPTKTVTLGVGCVLIASALWFALQGTASLHELLITLFLFLTAPVSAQLMVKAALALDPSARPALPGTTRHRGVLGTARTRPGGGQTEDLSYAPGPAR